jgi:phage gpG-like protein
MAGVRFRGDFAKLQKLADAFGKKLATPQWRTELNRKLAAESLDLTMEGFERSIDPYGRRWKKLKYRVGQPLLDTGRLRASIRPLANAARFELKTPVVYAATHQHGRDAIPRRMYLPNGARGFGSRWSRRLARIVRQEVKTTLGR